MGSSRVCGRTHAEKHKKGSLCCFATLAGVTVVGSSRVHVRRTISDKTKDERKGGRRIRMAPARAFLESETNINLAPVGPNPDIVELGNSITPARSQASCLAPLAKRVPSTPPQPSTPPRGTPAPEVCKHGASQNRATTLCGSSLLHQTQGQGHSFICRFPLHCAPGYHVVKPAHLCCGRLDAEGVPMSRLFARSNLNGDLLVLGVRPFVEACAQQRAVLHRSSCSVVLSSWPHTALCVAAPCIFPGVHCIRILFALRMHRAAHRTVCAVPGILFAVNCFVYHEHRTVRVSCVCVCCLGRTHMCCSAHTHMCAANV